MTVIKGITRFCQILEHPIVDSLARCLDDDNFVCALAATCTDLVGQRMVMENDDVFNRAALVYVETLRYLFKFLNLFLIIFKANVCALILFASGSVSVAKRGK